MSCTLDPETHEWSQPGGARCTEQHCTARTRCANHVAPTELTCGKCIGKTRNGLGSIVDISGQLLTETVHRGINSEAAYLAGPVPDYRMLIKRRTLIKSALSDLDFDVQAKLLAKLPDDDPHHPLAVLGRWEMMLREEYGPETTKRVNVVDAAAYLDTRLHRVANDPHQDFPLFVSEIARCRSHLEQVIHDARHGDRGAPCHLCDTGTFIRKHDEAIQTDTHGKPIKDRDGEVIHMLDEFGRLVPDDYWQCDNCRAMMSDEDYRRFVQVSHVATADRLTLSDMTTRTRIPKGTLKRWAAGWQPTKGPRRDPLIKPVGRNEHGSKLYRVDDVLTLRDTPKAEGS